ncbi:MAG: hypothetical protein ACREQM_14010, partial [Candidatus Dormibacteraceae bacterium]
MDDIECQVRANLQPAPDWRLRVTEVNSHDEALELSELGPAQLRVSRLCWSPFPRAEARHRAGELSEVIEPSAADDRLELAQNFGLSIVLAHACVRFLCSLWPTIGSSLTSTALAATGITVSRWCTDRPASYA